MAARCDPDPSPTAEPNLQGAGKDRFWDISPTGTGSCVTMPGPIRAMVRDHGNTLWIGMDLGLSSMNDRFLTVRAQDRRDRTAKHPQSGIASACSTESGDLWMAQPGESWKYELHGKNRSVPFTRHLNPGFCYRSMDASRDGLVLLGVDPEVDQVGVHHFPDRRSRDQSHFHRVHLHPGSRPGKVVRVSDGLFAYTAPGHDVIGFIAADGANIMDTRVVARIIPEPGTTRPGLGIHGAVLGPDGNLWFTMKTARAIGWLSPDGRTGHFPLPEGMVPEDITAGGDGNLYFTLEGQGAIGCIRAFPPAPPPDGPREPVETKDETREMATRVPETAAAPREEVPAPAGAAAVPPALDRSYAALQRLGVEMDVRTTTHILSQHGHGLPLRKGQFLPETSAGIGVPVQALVLEGLRRAGGLAGGVRRFDAHDSRHTLCTFDEPIGRARKRVRDASGTLVWGPWEPTRCLDVVTRTIRPRKGAFGATRHVVKSAYPVPEGTTVDYILDEDR